MLSLNPSFYFTNAIDNSEPNRLDGDQEAGSVGALVLMPLALSPLQKRIGVSLWTEMNHKYDVIMRMTIAKRSIASQQEEEVVASIHIINIITVDTPTFIPQAFIYVVLPCLPW